MADRDLRSIAFRTVWIVGPFTHLGCSHSVPAVGRYQQRADALRHTTAMELLQAGVDRSVIALWLGHESVETTQIYLDANLALKEDALKKMSPLQASVGRFKPDDQLLTFLRNL